MVVAQPLRLVGEQPERGGMRLRKAEAGEADELVEDASAVSSSTPFLAAPSTKRPRYASSASWLRLRLIARRSPSASPTVKPASAIATSSTWSWKTTTPKVAAQRLAQKLVVDGQT